MRVRRNITEEGFYRKVRVGFGKYRDKNFSVEEFPDVSEFLVFPEQLGKNGAAFLLRPGSSLAEFLNIPRKKEELSAVFHQLWNIFLYFEENIQRFSRLTYTMNSIYVTAATLEIQFLYLPFGNKELPRQSVLTDMLYFAIPKDFDTRVFLCKLLMLFHTTPLSEKEIYAAFFQEHNPQLFSFYEEKCRNTVYRQAGKQQEETVNLAGTTYAESFERRQEEETVLISREEPLRCSEKIPRIFRQSSGEYIPIYGERLRMGSEVTYVDYVILDNPRVSRSHCEIIKNEDGYYLRDCDSKEGTFFNGERLERKQEILLTAGDTFSLAEELFLFFP